MRDDLPSRWVSRGCGAPRACRRVRRDGRSAHADTMTRCRRSRQRYFAVPYMPPRIDKVSCLTLPTHLIPRCDEFATPDRTVKQTRNYTQTCCPKLLKCSQHYTRHHYIEGVDTR